ncbi:MAG: glutamate--cysteine ligase [Halobacteriaceae archaeon]
MAEGRAAFTEFGTLGIEEEYFVVDERGRPTAGTDTLVHEASPPDPIAGRLDHELFKFVIETQTPKLDGPGEAAAALHEMRDALVSYAADHGYRIAAAGLHPAAVWRELEHADKPRYRDQLDRIRYPQHRNTTAGLHVHVGVDDPDAAVWIANELRWYLPVLLALSANSPYWNGFDTGLASARAKVFETLPNTGMPTAFEDYESFACFERLLLETDSISDRGEIWWDVRPHSGHGTVEVRTPDAQADPERVLAFVEYVHALVVDLAERYADGESGHDHRRELLDENKWRATRHGHDASFIARDAREEVSLPTVVDRTADRLGVDGVRDVLESGSGAARQRRIHDRDGPDALYESLVL